MASMYEKSQGAIETEIRVGIALEGDCPHCEDVVKSFTEEQIVWVASWLAGGGFGKLEDK